MNLFLDWCALHPVSVLVGGGAILAGAICAAHFLSTSITGLLSDRKPY